MSSRVQVKKGPIVVLALILGVGLFFGIRALVGSGGSHESVVPKVASLPALPDPAVSSKSATPTAPLSLPGKVPVSFGTDVRMEVWAWNAQMGLLYAAGGKDTTQGSLMAAHNVNLH